MTLDTPVSSLNRVGKVVQKRLAHLGVETVRDLLFYFPFRYEDFSQTKPIVDLQANEQITIKGKIELIANKRSPRKRMIITEAVVADDSDQLRVVWFGQPFIAKNLKVGDTVYLSGKVTGDMLGLQMIGPTYEKARGGGTHTGRIVPIYPLTSGITQKQLRFLMKQVIPLAKKIEEWLPADIRDKADVMGLGESIEQIHFPDSGDDVKHAEQRLKFDELFVLQLRAEMVRQSLARSISPSIKFNEESTKNFVESLPFTLTNAQKKAAWEILQDLEKKNPMNRMLEGDVGSGKTVVAAMSLLNTALNSFQAVMLAPTEILAKQHYSSVCDLLGDKFKIGILSRTEFSIFNFKFSEKSKAGKKREMIDLIKKGAVDVVVGTHALIQEAVEFKNLGLVIVDEQHRFGVEQRKKIKEKSVGEETPHFLSMTATPIPRSFALTLYGDLDLSIINQMPMGRKTIKTRVVDQHNRNKAYKFIKEQIKQGRQVFVICPLIAGESDKKSVMTEYEKLDRKVFPNLKVAFLHGKMKAKEKDETMDNFSSGKINILVSTSVVEVGVNIPNASVMMIEGAESFGLAQLHQFRGRVGRSDHQSYCFVFTDSDSLKVKERLKVFESNTDGFRLAEYDLDMRGPGEVYGSVQSGLMNLKLATMRDKNLIKAARDLARGIDFEKYPIIKEKVKEWENGVHLE